MSQLVKLVILLDKVPEGQLYLLVSMFGSIIFSRQRTGSFSLCANSGNWTKIKQKYRPRYGLLRTQ